MNLLWKTYRADDSGAITVDWVVLTAAIIGLGMLILIPIAFGTDSLSTNVSTDISGINSGYRNN